MILRQNHKRDSIETLVNKISLILLIFLLINNCSISNKVKFWEEKDIIEKTKNTKIILTDQIQVEKEFNPNIKIVIPDVKYKKNYINNQNDISKLDYNGNLKKIGKYNFSKFKDFQYIDIEPIFHKNKLIFFDSKGTILLFGDNQKILWKENFYSKGEKKLKPRLNFAIHKDKLIVTDDVAKYYMIDIKSQKIIWVMSGIVPFNSDIKIHKDVFFVVDYKNILRCFSIQDGTELWNLKTEESLTKSNDKLSIVTDNENVYFNNSIGDITAVNIKSGDMVWQLPTQGTNISSNAFRLNSSNLVINKKSIFFSNNKNEFYSIDVLTGLVNWISNLSSNLQPVIIDKFILTISNGGYLYLMNKNTGNVIRINDLYQNYKNKKRNNVRPTGFVVGKNKIYLTSDDGNLIVADLNTGNILKSLKISRSKITKPIIHQNNLFLIQNDSIFKYN